MYGRLRKGQQQPHVEGGDRGDPWPANSARETRPRSEKVGELCNGLGAWGSRLRAAVTRCKAACHRCSEMTLTCCRGCDQRLCMRCARNHTACRSVTRQSDLRQGLEQPPVEELGGQGVTAVTAQHETRDHHRRVHDEGAEHRGCDKARPGPSNPRRLEPRGSRDELLRDLSTAADCWSDARARPAVGPTSEFPERVQTCSRDGLLSEPADDQQSFNERPQTVSAAPFSHTGRVQRSHSARAALLRSLASGAHNARLIKAGERPSKVTRTNSDHSQYRLCGPVPSEAADAGRPLGGRQVHGPAARGRGQSAPARSRQASNFNRTEPFRVRGNEPSAVPDGIYSTCTHRHHHLQAPPHFNRPAAEVSTGQPPLSTTDAAAAAAAFATCSVLLPLPRVPAFADAADAAGASQEVASECNLNEDQVVVHHDGSPIPPTPMRGAGRGTT